MPFDQVKEDKRARDQGKDPRAKYALDRWDQLKSDRIHDEDDWQEIDLLIRGTGFGGFATGDKNDQRQKSLSSIPLIARANYAADLYGTLTNQANNWMELASPDPDLAKWGPMKEWSAVCTRVTMGSFRPAVSNFYRSTIQLFNDVVSFAQGAQYDEMQTAEGRILDLTIHLGEVVVGLDAFGNVVEFVRRYRLTGKQAANAYGYDKLPKKLQEAVDKGNPERWVFFHHVYKNEAYERGRFGPKGKQWASIHAVEEGCAVVRHSGYRDQPMYFPRWETVTGRTYGFGLGHYALPASRVLMQMRAANLRSGQRAADPTLLAPDREAWALNGTAAPGRTIYGGVDMRGNPLVRPLDNFANTGLSLEMQQQMIEEIQNSFHWSLLNLTSRTGLTPIEAQERVQEKLRVQAPNLGGIQSEFLAPKVRRRFRMLFENGQIPPPPDGLPADATLDVQYKSVAAMAQQAAEGTAINHVVASLAPLMQIKPRLGERIDADELAEALVDAQSAPAQILKTREEADEEEKQRTEQQKAMMALQAGKDVAQIGATMASAEGGK